MQQWKELLENRLRMVGITDYEEDTIDFIMGSVAEKIKNFCNINTIPEEVKYTYVNMCVAEYLFLMISSGQIPYDSFFHALKTITEGDVSYSYAVPESNAADINAWIAEYRKLSLHSLIRVRKLPRWGCKKEDP